MNQENSNIRRIVFPWKVLLVVFGIISGLVLAIIFSRSLFELDRHNIPLQKNALLKGLNPVVQTGNQNFLYQNESNDDLYFYNNQTKTSQKVLVVDNPELIADKCLDVLYDLSPDLNKFVLSLSNHCKSQTIIAIYSITGQKLEETNKYSYIRNLRWSPDGKHIVFSVGYTDNVYKSELLLFDQNLNYLDKIALINDYSDYERGTLSWNPVGDQIAYLSNNGDINFLSVINNKLIENKKSLLTINEKDNFPRFEWIAPNIILLQDNNGLQKLEISEAEIKVYQAGSQDFSAKAKKINGLTIGYRLAGFSDAKILLEEGLSDIFYYNGDNGDNGATVRKSSSQIVWADIPTDWVFVGNKSISKVMSPEI